MDRPYFFQSSKFRWDAVLKAQVLWVLSVESGMWYLKSGNRGWLLPGALVWCLKPRRVTLRFLVPQYITQSKCSLSVRPVTQKEKVIPYKSKVYLTQKPAVKVPTATNYPSVGRCKWRMEDVETADVKTLSDLLLLKAAPACRTYGPLFLCPLIVFLLSPYLFHFLPLLKNKNKKSLSSTSFWITKPLTGLLLCPLPSSYFSTIVYKIQILGKGRRKEKKQVFVCRIDLEIRTMLCKIVPAVSVFIDCFFWIHFSDNCCSCELEGMQHDIAVGCAGSKGQE